MSLSFKNWMFQVNAGLIDACGFSIEDLPDWDYASKWLSGVSVRLAVRAILINARSSY